MPGGPGGGGAGRGPAPSGVRTRFPGQEVKLKSIFPVQTGVRARGPRPTTQGQAGRQRGPSGPLPPTPTTASSAGWKAGSATSATEIARKPNRGRRRDGVVAAVLPAACVWARKGAAKARQVQRPSEASQMPGGGGGCEQGLPAGGARKLCDNTHTSTDDSQQSAPRSARTDSSNSVCPHSSHSVA